ncbi:MAG: DUF2203 domain-containing protein [Oscillatoriales cyanobacterium]|nr:MAG: DUF2203 domain-containing protein [Oscillatoriales cyanobacterium]
MARPQKRPTPDRPEPLSEEAEFAAFLMDLTRQVTETEAELAQVRSRLEQVGADRARRMALGDRVEVVRADLARARDQAVRDELQAELRTVQAQLAEIDLALESRLFAESGLQEVFWQAVRFGSLGLVAGWLLKLWAG